MDFFKFFFPRYVCVLLVYLVSVGSLGAGVVDVVKYRMRCGEPNLRHLEGSPVYLTP